MKSFRSIDVQRYLKGYLILVENDIPRPGFTPDPFSEEVEFITKQFKDLFPQVIIDGTVYNTSGIHYEDKEDGEAFEIGEVFGILVEDYK